MPDAKPRLVGVELYFEDLETAKRFYRDTLGLKLLDERPSHHAKSDSAGGFVCLERKGSESYPSLDKAVVFLEVSDLRTLVEAIGSHRLVHFEQTEGEQPTWAVLYDPEGHNVVLLQAPANTPRS